MRHSLVIFLPLAQLALLLFSAQLRAESCDATVCHRPVITHSMHHKPVQDGDCFACHKRVETIHPVFGGKSFELTAKVPKLCFQCHDVIGLKKVVHGPLNDGDCLVCHKIHGAEGRYLLDTGDDLTPLCVKCHDAAAFTQKFMHGPVAVGACGECHSPHDSTEKGLLLHKSTAVCLRCHDDFTKAMSGTDFIHQPVKDKPCTSCHNPHGSPVSHLLKKKMPDICLDCHEGVGKKLHGTKSVHKPLIMDGSCTNCHLPHVSKAKWLLPSDEKSSCLGCHNTDKLGTPPMRNIKKELQGKKYLHGPIEAGECVTCHDPHGSDFSILLKGNYPAAFYEPFKEGAYDFCLKCHDKNMLRYADTSLYTNFRNGKANLHFVHVADKRKGRSCQACHEPHASNMQKLISKDGPPFGEWKIPIRFEITPTGGSCAPGCHRAFRYDRDKPVNYKLEVKK